MIILEQSITHVFVRTKFGTSMLASSRYGDGDDDSRGTISF